MKRIRTAVFPAAGLGTRFLPATKAQPKEMLPIIDKPVIQYLVEEAVASGIEKIIIVTGRGKRSIEDHFDHSFELSQILREKGKDKLLKTIEEIENLAHFIFVRQSKPLGDGHAILCAKEALTPDEPFAVLFGDDIVDGAVPALKQLINVYEQTGTSVIALEKIDKKDAPNYGMVKINENNEIEDMVEKPSPANAPSDLGIIGKYIVTPEIINALENATSGHGGEIRLIDGLIKLKEQQKIHGCEIQGKRYDTGNKFGFIEATIDFALKRPDLAPHIKKYILSHCELKK